MFADLERFEALRLVRRDPGKSTRVAAIAEAVDAEFLTGQRDR